MGPEHAEIASLKEKIASLEGDLDRLRAVSRLVTQTSHIFAPPQLSKEQTSLIDAFNNFAYHIEDEGKIRTYFSSWMGHEMFKWPTDLWSYQELIVRTRPDIIIETGTYRGGSALFLASICDLMDHGEVVSVDIDEGLNNVRPIHPRVSYLGGSSVDLEIISKVETLVGGRRAMVILDSDHRCEHVLRELQLYERFVHPGDYLVVEDTLVNGHPAYPNFGPGPWEAVEIFTKENDNFFIDRRAERVYLTQNPCGFLRRRDV